jgi:hypothetical protein
MTMIGEEQIAEKLDFKKSYQPNKHRTHFPIVLYMWGKRSLIKREKAQITNVQK